MRSPSPAHVRRGSREARTLIAALPAEIRATTIVRRFDAWIRSAARQAASVAGSSVASPSAG